MTFISDLDSGAPEDVDLRSKLDRLEQQNKKMMDKVSNLTKQNKSLSAKVSEVRLLVTVIYSVVRLYQHASRRGFNVDI